MENWLIGQAIAFVVIMLFGLAVKLMGQKYEFEFALWPLIVGFLCAFLVQALVIKPWEK